MSYLYLIRHPLTVPDPVAPASSWGLSDAGHAQVRDLIAAPFWTRVRAVYTSDQYKAAVVGEAAAAAHAIPHYTIPDLTEAKRDSWAGRDAFLAAQGRFFAQPDDPPLPGWEPARSAGERFRAAVDGVLARHPADESLVVVAHATVLTLYNAHLCGEPPSFAFWQGIGFAAVQAVDRATLQPLTAYLAAPFDGLPVG